MRGSRKRLVGVDVGVGLIVEAHADKNMATNLAFRKAYETRLSPPRSPFQFPHLPAYASALEATQNQAELHHRGCCYMAPRESCHIPLYTWCKDALEPFRLKP